MGRGPGGPHCPDRAEEVASSTPARRYGKALTTTTGSLCGTTSCRVNTRCTDTLAIAYISISRTVPWKPWMRMAGAGPPVALAATDRFRGLAASPRRGAARTRKGPSIRTHDAECSASSSKERNRRIAGSGVLIPPVSRMLSGEALSSWICSEGLALLVVSSVRMESRAPLARSGPGGLTARVGATAHGAAASLRSRLRTRRKV